MKVVKAVEEYFVEDAVKLKEINNTLYMFFLRNVARDQSAITSKPLEQVAMFYVHSTLKYA